MPDLLVSKFTPREWQQKINSAVKGEPQYFCIDIRGENN